MNRGMYLKVNAPTKHTDTPSPRPARPDLYNIVVVRVLSTCVLPDSLVSRVSQAPALGRLDRRHAHRAQSRGGRAWLWSLCIPPLPPRPPSPPAATCYPWARTSPRHPLRASRASRPHGLTAGHALGSSGVDLASCMLAPRTLGESCRAPLSLPCVHPESTLSRGSACRAQAPF